MRQAFELLYFLSIPVFLVFILYFVIWGHTRLLSGHSQLCAHVLLLDGLGDQVWTSLNPEGISNLLSKWSLSLSTLFLGKNHSSWAREIVQKLMFILSLKSNLD